MTCPACDRAATALHGEYRANCRGCWVRSLASAPAFIRRQAYEAVRDDDERATLKREVSAEWQRQKGLMEGRA